MRACLSVSCGFLVAGIILGAPAVGWAQGQLGTKDGLKKAYDDSSPRWKKLLSGEEAPKDGEKAANNAAAKAIAEFHLYRLTHLTEPQQNVVKEFNDFVTKYQPEVTTKRDNRRYLSEYVGPALVAAMKDVLPADGKPDRGMLVHAAMMMPAMARVKSDPVFDYFVALTGNPKTHDVINLYAIKGLRDAMPITVQPDDLNLNFNDKAQNDKRARDKKYVDALKTFIEKKRDLSGMSYEEASAVRFIRREAIITLAQAGSPAVSAVLPKQAKKGVDNPDGLVAPTLLKVLAGNLQPPPSSQEKIEAAIGLCNMKHPNMPEYNPNLATYLIGQLILDLSAEYSKDLQNFALVGADKRLPFIAWKTESKRLKVGLDVFAKANKTKAAGELLVNADSILNQMENHKALNDANLGDLRRKVNDFRTAATDTIFMTLKSPPVFPQK